MTPEQWIELLTGLVRRVESQTITEDDIITANRLLMCNWLHALAGGNHETLSALAEVVKTEMIYETFEEE